MTITQLLLLVLVKAMAAHRFKVMALDVIQSNNNATILEIENNGATTLRLTRTNSVSNYCLFEAAGTNSEQLKIETDPAEMVAVLIYLKMEEQKG